MSNETCISDRIEPLAEQETSGGRGVDEKRWLALSEAGRFALAVASLDTEQESFENVDEMTKTLMATTAFEREKVVEMNKLFVKEEYCDRSGFGTAGPLKLVLKDKGYKFLEKELIKSQ